jgi:hypothetical protein
MIPKIVHVTWKTKEVLRSNSPLIQNGLKKLVELNPDWEVRVYDDSDIETYLQQNLSADYDLIRDDHIVAKSDLWRLIKIYLEGGLYIDVDRLCNVKLSTIVDKETKWVLPTYKDSDFSQDFMMSAPNNPAFSDAAGLNMWRRRQGHRNVYYLGPQTYMNAISYSIFGKMADTNPGVEFFDEFRELVGRTPFLKTYREDPPYNTILYQDGVHDGHENMKRELYKEFCMKHWTGEW